MKGRELVRALGRKFAGRGTHRVLARNQLARRLGTTGANLWRWMQPGRTITPLQVANLVATAMGHARLTAEREAIEPIIEFFDLEPDESRRGRRVELFSPSLAERHPYLRGLREQLKQHRGIYIFYDSRGRALYAGKASRRSLWGEMKSAFNRERDVQKIKQVRHPHNRVPFLSSKEKVRQIRAEEVVLYDLAKYASAYAVPPGLIGTLEALLVRGFANDLLNVRMEHFQKRRIGRGKKAKSPNT